MIEEPFAKVKTHLIITDIHEEFDINWCGKFAAVAPKLDLGRPMFVIIGRNGRVEISTFDMQRLEDIAKRLTEPKGRGAVMSDSAHIYIKEENGEETLMCIVTHKRVKSYAPMYDKIQLS